MFGETHVRRYCGDCGRYVLAQLKSASIFGHAALTLFTCGLWFPVALACAVYYGVARPAACPACGGRC